MASSAYNFGPPIAKTASPYPGVSVATVDSWKKQDLRLVMKEKRKKGIWSLYFYEVVFSCFFLWVKDLIIFELRFGFVMKNSMYGQMETFGNHQLS